MKTKIPLIVLLLVCVGLAVSLIHLNKKAAEQRREDEAMIKQASNQWVSVNQSLDEEKQNTLKLAKDVAEKKDQVVNLSKDLSQKEEALAKTEAALKSAQEETAKRDAKIAELETQKLSLEEQVASTTKKLETQRMALEGKIAETTKKLASAEGDKAFLEKELKRLMVEKTELEHRFNDLALMKEQVSKLKAELSLARRIELESKGVFAAAGLKGAERIRQGAGSPRLVSTPVAGKTNYDLVVEMRSGGGSRIVPVTNQPPPIPASTNKP